MNIIKPCLFFCLIFSGLQSQQTINGTLTHDGITREYILYVPKSYTTSDALPMVLNFHGYTSSANSQMFYGNFRAIADRENFLVVHPQGTVGDDGETYWNAQWNPNGIDDIGFTAALIDSISAKFNVNQKRIYSTGMSNGGFMSYTLACELSDRIAAIASVTGTMTVDQLNNSCNPENTTPIMQIHGTDDSVVPYDGNVWMAPIEDVLDFWREKNACQPYEFTKVDDISTNDDSTVEHEVNRGCAENADVEFFRINGGTHTWPGSAIDFGVTNYDINASEEIWRFFSQYDLDGKLSSVDEEVALDFNLSPTIVSDRIELSFSTAGLKDVRVIDMNGVLLFSVRVAGNETIIPAGHLTSGIYLIQVQKDKEIHLRRFVKP